MPTNGTSNDARRCAIAALVAVLHATTNSFPPRPSSSRGTARRDRSLDLSGSPIHLMRSGGCVSPHSASLISARFAAERELRERLGALVMRVHQGDIGSCVGSQGTSYAKKDRRGDKRSM